MTSKYVATNVYIFTRPPRPYIGTLLSLTTAALPAPTQFSKLT